MTTVSSDQCFFGKKFSSFWIFLIETSCSWLSTMLWLWTSDSRGLLASPNLLSKYFAWSHRSYRLLSPTFLANLGRAGRYETNKHGWQIGDFIIHIIHYAHPKITAGSGQREHPQTCAQSGRDFNFTGRRSWKVEVPPSLSICLGGSRWLDPAVCIVKCNKCRWCSQQKDAWFT